MNDPSEPSSHPAAQSRIGDPVTDEPESAARPTPSEKASPRSREATRVFAVALRRHRAGRLDEAVRSYTKALALDPRAADVYNNLGAALRAQGKLEAAVACYRRALRLRPDAADIYSNLGNALRDLCRYDDAAANHREAVRLAPVSADALYNLGLVLRDLGQIDDSITCFDKALVINPDHAFCRWDRALALLFKGDLETGFAEYEWRWKLPHHPPREVPKPRWDGGDLDSRTLLVLHEQGFGDMIQFVRFAPALKALGADVVVECQPELVRLLSTAPGVDGVFIRGNRTPDFDVYAPMASLPAFLGTTLETIPDRFPYVSPPEVHDVDLPVPAGTQFKVGVAWAGSRTHKNDLNRSCPFVHFLEIMGMPGVAFYSLQTGPAAGELAHSACEGLVVDVARQIDDFADTAAVIAQLDLVIAVDTAVVHLAGALGKPVWVVLSHVGDWRWMTGRDDSPWYPSLRLFRQKTPGDWEGTLTAVRDALEKLARGKNARSDSIRPAVKRLRQKR